MRLGKSYIIFLSSASSSSSSRPPYHCHRLTTRHCCLTYIVISLIFLFSSHVVVGYKSSFPMSMSMLLSAKSCSDAFRMTTSHVGRSSRFSVRSLKQYSELSSTADIKTTETLQRSRICHLLYGSNDPSSSSSSSRSSAMVGSPVLVKGWVRTMRSQKKFSFIELNDGTTAKGIQIVADASLPSYDEVTQLTTGAAAEITGTLVASRGREQSVEIQASHVKLVGACPADTYPLQKKLHTNEFLRSQAHLRARTATLSAVSRVRSVLSFATHQFFQGEDFVHVHTPYITSSDCEGAGEMFRVTSLPLHDLTQVPRMKPQEQLHKGTETASRKATNATTAATSAAASVLEAETIEAAKDALTKKSERDLIDFSQDFFGKPTFLTVSGQLSGETYACAMGDIYTFGPTFRAEHSQTTKHLAEFHMIEPEMAFADMWAAIDNAEKFVKFVVRECLDKCEKDLLHLERVANANAVANHTSATAVPVPTGETEAKATAGSSKGAARKSKNQEHAVAATAAAAAAAAEVVHLQQHPQLIARLRDLVNKPFAVISYGDAIELLQVEIAKDRSKWQYPDVAFGTDLNTEHERWLSDKHFNHSCVFVHNYPRKIKSFYMRDNADGQTVDAFDLLVPGIGELIGGSQREERLDQLVAKMKEFNMKTDEYEWYLDLRRYGTVPHSGYGLGFERLVTLVTGVENIRESIAFPRYYGSAEF